MSLQVPKRPSIWGDILDVVIGLVVAVVIMTVVAALFIGGLSVVIYQALLIL